MAAQQTITQTISDKRSEKGFSNFEETVASASSIDLTALDLGYAGIITLTGNTTVNHPTTFKATNGNSITFTHTDLGSATATSIALRQQSDLTIVGRANESDSITISFVGNNRNKEVDHVILVKDGAIRVNAAGEIGIGTNPVTGQPITVTELFATVAKHFSIKHEDYTLNHTSLEGNENGVYFRGKLEDGNIIELPEYWKWLVDADSITVHLTPIGSSQDLFYSIEGNNIIVSGNSPKCSYLVQGERKDIDKLKVIS